MALPVGSKAPDFSLRSMAEGGVVDVKLSDNFGVRPTVLMFFPAVYSPPCTEEICGLAKSAYPDFGDAAVYGISVDSPFAQLAWTKQESLPFQLLSDMDRCATQAFDVAVEDFLGTGGVASARAVFVIDKDGVVRYSYQTPKLTDMPDFEAVKAALAELK
jgi:peroxiredoxin